MDTTRSSDNQAKALATLQDGLPRKRADGSVRQALLDRMTISEGIEAAGRIVGAYPNGGRDASKSYLGAIASTLASYPRQIALACADPVNGVTRDCKFLPTVSDIVAWCERKTEPLQHRAAREQRIADQLAARTADEVVRDRRLTYDELKAKYGDGKGGWGVNGINDKPRWSPPSADELRKQIGDDAWDKLKSRVAAE